MSSYPMTETRQMGHQLGGGAFNHSQSKDAEAEYDRLRDLARQEASKRGACFDKAHKAYEQGDGASAHELSAEGKKHAAQMDAYNKQASDYIFRENNSTGRVADDTIDLHGQFVNEAEDILETRIRHAQQTGQTHLHVIVGKGNHSRDHVQKIKPKVEQVCQELGLQFATEENAGRMYINLQGGPAVMPPYPDHGSAQGQKPQQQQQQSGGQQGYQNPLHTQEQQQSQQHQQQQYAQEQQHFQQQGGNADPNDQLEKLAKKFLPKILKSCEGCCVVM